jgi:hypothetical protein
MRFLCSFRQERKAMNQREHERRLQELAQAEAQEEKRRQAEIELLESADDMQEFIRRRKATKYLLVNPEQTLDEMCFSDYKKVREQREASFEKIEEALLKTNAFTFEDYRQMWK